MEILDRDDGEELEKKINEIAEAFANQAASATFAKVRQMLYAAMSQEREPDQNVIELKYVVELVGKIHIDGNQIISAAADTSN